MPTKMTPKKTSDEIKTSDVTTFGLQLYKEAKFTFAIAKGINNSKKIIPFVILSNLMY